MFSQYICSTLIQQFSKLSLTTINQLTTYPNLHSHIIFPSSYNNSYIINLSLTKIKMRPIKQSSSQQKQQHLLKLIIIGDSGVGKTNILVRFCNNQFKQNYVATIGVDFKIKTITVNDHRLKFQIWDTAGQERYKNIAQTYYKGAHGIILTYSINDSQSFDNVDKWMTQINQHAPKEVMRILVANKLDLEAERQVSHKQGEVLAKKYNIPFIELSAKDGTNVNKAFQVMGERLVEELLPTLKMEKNSTRLTGLHSQKKKNKNCEC